MKLEEFEKKLLFFVRNSEEKIVESNVAYYLGISLSGAKNHLEELANSGVLMLDSDDNGNLFYTMPNVYRKHDEEALKQYFFSFSKMPQLDGTFENKVYSQRRCPFCMEIVNPNAKKCRHCGEIIDVTLLKRNKKPFPHIFHLIMMFFTGGGWLVIYILHYLLRKK